VVRVEHDQPDERAADDDPWAEEPGPPPEASAAEPWPPARRYGPVARAVLTTLLVCSGALSLAWQALIFGHLEQTAALFVGLPVLLGILVVQLTRVRSVYGRVLQANIVFLGVVAPLLGEGSICLLMAAPVFFAISLVTTLMLTVVAGKVLKKPYYAIALLPLLYGLAERHSGLFDPPVETVETVALVEGSLEVWRAAVRASAPVAAHDSWFLRLGFPLPESYRVDSERGRAEIGFTRAEGVKGSWLAEVDETDAGVRFEVLEDTTKIAHWIEVLDSEVELSPAGPGRVELRQTTRFVPLLSPRWYFVPLERHAFARAHELALETWKRR